MALAVMLSTDREAFICDMAETYHILDYRALPVSTLAVLASGLREDSRIRMKMMGMQRIPLEVLAAKCADTLALILYVLGADSKASRPTPLTDIIFGESTRKETAGFASGADFEKERKRLLEVVNNG